MLVYSQTTGFLDWPDGDGVVLGQGYSGHGEYKNKPDFQDLPGRGPIPQGLYTIGEIHDDPHLGPAVMALSPYDSNQMFMRSGFFIHGDAAAHPGDASSGCLIFNHQERLAIWATGDRQLCVMA